MKTRSRFTSAAALCLAVFIVTAPVFALPPRAGRDTDRDRDLPPIVRFIKKISKVFGIRALEDLPGPPKP